MQPVRLPARPPPVPRQEPAAANQLRAEVCLPPTETDDDFEPLSPKEDANYVAVRAASPDHHFTTQARGGCPMLPVQQGQPPLSRCWELWPELALSSPLPFGCATVGWCEVRWGGVCGLGAPPLQRSCSKRVPPGVAAQESWQVIRGQCKGLCERSWGDAAGSVGAGRPLAGLPTHSTTTRHTHRGPRPHSRTRHPPCPLRGPPAIHPPHGPFPTHWPLGPVHAPRVAGVPTACTPHRRPFPRQPAPVTGAGTGSE